MAVAFIGVGSNLGNRDRLIASAVDRLRSAPGVVSVLLSPLHETDPVGGLPGQPPFLNAAARVETTLSPQRLLQLLLSIESELGRERRERWGPRTIDLDLLLYGDEVIDTPELILPHPRLHERRFVLEPLAEIAPDVTHPVMHRSIKNLLGELSRS